MRSIIFSFVVIALIFALSACDASSIAPASQSDDTLTQMWNALGGATDAAATAHRGGGVATSRADATREYLVLIGQQTRIAQQAIQTQTVFSQNVTSTAISRNATETRAVEDVRATATVAAINATATTQSAQFTATAHSQSVSATATTQAVIVEQTRVAASATATAISDNRTQTRVSEVKTATHDTEVERTFAEKQNWERTTESVRSVGMVIGVVLFVVGGLIVVGFVGYRSVTLLVQQRARQYRDSNGELVVQLPNGDFVRPVNMPGAYLPTSADRALPSGTQNDAVTRRAQAVSLALAGITLEEELDSDEPNETPAQTASWEIEQAFQSKPLPLHQQPNRLALPVGVKQDGTDLWVPLPAFAHALVAGTSGMGKTRFLHGWIAALMYGGKAEMMLVDRKAGVEFARYADRPLTKYVEDDQIGQSLDALMNEIENRNRLLRAAGATNIAEYNRTNGIPSTLSHIVVIIDEIADLQEHNIVDTLIELARKSRSSGAHLIFSTQNPDSKTIHPQILANAILRVAFSVPHHINSVAILGCGGAQKLGGITGRMLVMFHGALVPCQAYQVELPRPAIREIEPPDAPRALLEQPAQSGESKPVSANLPSNILQMVHWAIGQGEGWFRIEDVARAVHAQTDEVNAAARWLEEKGLLTPVLRNERGHNLGRQISAQLKALV